MATPTKEKQVMATATIELRLANLEAEVTRLKQKLEEPQPHWVDQVYGAFAEDADFLEAMRLGREYRESLRPQETEPVAKTTSKTTSRAKRR